MTAPDAARAAIHVLLLSSAPAGKDLAAGLAETLHYKTTVEGRTEAALELIEGGGVDVLVADVSSATLDEQELVAEVRRRSPDTRVVLAVEAHQVPAAREALRLGACDFVTKPCDPEEVLVQVNRNVEALLLERENRLLRAQAPHPGGFGRLLGAAPAMQKLYRAIAKVSDNASPVLISGESGTGKELVARTIHENGPRRDQPFVVVDCAALVPSLIESELFGHVKGAFTGAVRSKPGLVETAGSGTLFLDEVAELPLDVQGKLLRALQEREMRPVGSTRTVRFDARIIAATNRDLAGAVERGSFRQDLYYRLNVVAIKAPPLRERKSDIPLLVAYFLGKFSPPELSREISGEALSRLVSHEWPGNVRELENCIERAVALSSGPVVQIADLPTSFHGPLSLGAGVSGPQPVVPLKDLEKQAIMNAIASTGGDKLLAARMLGIGKTTLYRKLKEYANNKEH